MSQIEDDLNVADYLERAGGNTPADYIIIRLAAEVRRLRQEVEPTDKMINAGLTWISGWQHMRMSDKRSNLSEAFKSMCRIRDE